MQLLPSLAITTPIASTQTNPAQLNGAPRNLTIQANFAYGSGGATVNAYVQTSLDGGVTWNDIAQFSFTTASAKKAYNLNAQTPVTTAVTPTTGSMAANTAQDGLLGPLLCVSYVTTGTYAGGTTLRIDVTSIDIGPFP